MEKEKSVSTKMASTVHNKWPTWFIEHLKSTWTCESPGKETNNQKLLNHQENAEKQLCILKHT